MDHRDVLTHGARGDEEAAGSGVPGCDSKLLKFLLHSVDVVFPWVLAVLIGTCTAATGVFIAVNCDYLSDVRFGMCSGLWFSDRNRCCGGADNFNPATESCVVPTHSMNETSSFRGVDWVPWEVAFQGEVSPFLVYVTTSVLLTAVTAFLVQAYSPPAKGSGIPDVKAAVSGFLISRSFSAVCLVMKTVGLSLVVGAGLALGKEGPLIQIGVCWAYVLRTTGGPLGALAGAIPLHELICVGAAAGVSTAFGAPIGGVLFAVEELGSVRALSQRALLLAFAGSFTASFTLKSWNIYGSNQLTFFRISTPTNSPKKEWLSWEISLFLLLGIIGGLGGSLFVRLNIFVATRRKQQLKAGRVWMIPSFIQSAVLAILPKGLLQLVEVKRSVSTESVSGTSTPELKLAPATIHVLEATIVAMITASLNYPFRLLRMPMVEVIHGLFETCPHSLGDQLGLCDESGLYGFMMKGSLVVSLLFASVVRLAQTIVTFGTMIPSGLFIPSLYVGATLGRIVGLWALTLNENLLGSHRTVQIDPSVFAMVGAVAMLSGFARMTVSLVVIMLELTGELNYAVPFMCAVLVAKLVGDSFTVSIYDAHSALLGFAMIEEPKGLRLSPHIVDVAEPCTASDILDASNPLTVENLQMALAGESLPSMEDTPSGGAKSDTDGVGLEEGTPGRLNGDRNDDDQMDGPRPAGLSTFVLRRGDAHSPVCGIVVKAQLLSWLNEMGARGDELCFFEPMSEEAPDLPLTDVRRLDASNLVETRLARFLANTPVLTAVCAFREDPDLKYCVCRDESDSHSVGVLSRSSFEKALRQGRFAAAFRDPKPSLVPRGRLAVLLDWLRGSSRAPLPKPQQLAQL